MRRLDVGVPDDLAQALTPYRDRLEEVLRLGLQQIESRAALGGDRSQGRASGTDDRRFEDTANIPNGVPPLVARLDARRAALSRGRRFDDSAELIRQERDARAAAQ
jgi:hypothetical protein